MEMRDLEWEGCWNARDLGGLRTVGGGLTRRHELVRSDALHLLPASAWRAVEAHGVRTLIDLRNPDQREQKPVAASPSLAILHLPLEEGLADEPAFRALVQSGHWATSFYLRAFLREWPERVARVLAAIAEAPSGVLFHCSKGSDRTGLIALALLAFARVEPDEIVADYERTAARLRAHGHRWGWADDAPDLQRVYERAGKTPRQGVLEALEALEPLRQHLGPRLVERLAQRLI